MSKKKSQRELIIDSLTKTRGQIYDEASKSEKIVYWVSLTFCLATIFLVLLFA